MNLYQLAADFAAQQNVFKNWPELADLFHRAASVEMHGWELPAIAGKTLGASHTDLIPAVAAIGCLQMSIIMIDDMLDEDPRGEYQTIGAGQAANFASALQSAGLSLLTALNHPPAASAALLAYANDLMGRTARGQYLDIQNPATEQQYWVMARSKSSPFFTGAFAIGALAAGASPQKAAAFAEFGALYGEIIQIHDDLKDTMATPAGPDWLQGRFPLPILFAIVVDHPDRETFKTLRTQAADPHALQHAQEILIRCGAVSYCIDQLMQRLAHGQDLIANLNLPHPADLYTLLAECATPVQELTNAVGVRHPLEDQLDFLLPA